MNWKEIYGILDRKVEEAAAGEEITTAAAGSNLTLSTSEGSLNALTVYGKSEIVDGAIKSAGDSGSIEIKTCGKNLFDPTVYSEYLQQDGTYKCNAGVLIAIKTSLKQYVGKTLTFSAYLSKSGEYPTNMRVTAIINGVTRNGRAVNAETYTRSTLTITPETKDDELCISYGSGSMAEIYFKDVQLEYGTTATAYEPYNGTMATFTTGTPLYGVSDTVRDVMEWDGSTGAVTKNCAKVRLADLTWTYASGHFLSNTINSTLKLPISNKDPAPMICSKYTVAPWSTQLTDKIIISLQQGTYHLWIKDTDYDTVTDFVASLGDAELVYQLATPTTEQLTTAENDSIAGLRTFAPTTHIQNNAGADMKIEAYAGTQNGKAIADLKKYLLKIVQQN